MLNKLFICQVQKHIVYGNHLYKENFIHISQKDAKTVDFVIMYSFIL